MLVENPIKFKSTDIIWQFTVDIIDITDDMKTFVRKVCKCNYVDAFLRPHTAEEQQYGPVDKYVKKNMDETFLEKIQDSDFHALSKEYLEDQNFSRFVLKSLRLGFPFKKKLFNCKMMLTVSKLGIGVFTFWVHIDEKLDSALIAELQLLPIKDVEIAVEIPRELLYELNDLSEKYSNYYNEINEKGTTIVLGMDFATLIFLYWCSLINVINDHSYNSTSFKDLELIKKKQYRHEARYIFPIVVINTTEPEYKSTDKMIKENPKQLYQILSHLHNLDYNLIRLDKIHEFLKTNMSERQDIAYLNATGSVVLIFGSELQEREFYILEALTIIEIIQIQRYYFGYLIKKLDRPLKKMNTRQISIIRSYISQGLNMYYSKLTGNSLASERLNYGKKIMELEDSFNIVNKKTELLGEALQSFSLLKSSIFEITVASILGLLSVFFVFLQLEDRLLNIILSIILLCVTLGFLTGFTLVSRYVWRWLKSKKIE